LIGHGLLRGYAEQTSEIVGARAARLLLESRPTEGCPSNNDQLTGSDRTTFTVGKPGSIHGYGCMSGGRITGKSSHGIVRKREFSECWHFDRHRILRYWIGM